DGVSPGDVERGDAPALRRRGPAGEHRRGARRTLQPRFHEPLMAEPRERDGQVAGVAGAEQGAPRGGLELETGHEPARQGGDVTGHERRGERALRLVEILGDRPRAGGFLEPDELPRVVGEIDLAPRNIRRVARRKSIARHAAGDGQQAFQMSAPRARALAHAWAGGEIFQDRLARRDVSLLVVDAAGEAAAARRPWTPAAPGPGRP